MSQGTVDSILSTQSTPSVALNPSTHSYTYYHAGPLFTLSDLHTNTLLSTLIHSKSNSQFIPLLPQDLEPRSLHPQSIRDTDILSLISCDVALFIYDGSELDSGTVVEYMLAKFADIPSVILRTDFRGAGDQGSVGGEAAGQTAVEGADGPDAWNLMSSFWPRTKIVRIDSIGAYKGNLAGFLRRDNGLKGTGGANLAASTALLEQVAGSCVKALREVVEMPAVMPKELRTSVLEWIKLMPGFREGSLEEARRVLDGKINGAI